MQNCNPPATLSNVYKNFVVVIIWYANGFVVAFKDSGSRNFPIKGNFSGRSVSRVDPRRLLAPVHPLHHMCTLLIA